MKRLIAFQSILLFVATMPLNGFAQTNLSLPTILINEPANNVSINAICVDVCGIFTERRLKKITVKGMNMEIPAFIRGDKFEARNVSLQPGTNFITAVAENIDGIVGTNTITIIGPTNINPSQVLPVQVQVAPTSGFVPLRVVFNVQANVPGKIQHVFYDFDGDNSPDQTNSDLRPFTNNYIVSGQFLPVVTIQTDVGRFSSLSGMMAMLASASGGPEPSTIDVQMPPVLMSSIKVADPVDIKWTATSNLYVLSGSTEAITEYDAKGEIIRSLSGIGSNPSGLGVDENGNVYVAVTSSNQVLKFKPTSNSFETDAGAGGGVVIGNKDGSNNNRGHYVAEPENNRVQVFPPANRGEGLRLSLSGVLGLNHPKSVAAVADFLEEKIYIADTGNNRVILIELPSDNPEAAWKHMIARLKAGDVQGAMEDFSLTSRDKYQEAYQSLSKDELLSTIKDMENIKPATIENDRAQYYFESIADGKTITFPIEFDREFGQWKIMEY